MEQIIFEKVKGPWVLIKVFILMIVFPNISMHAKKKKCSPLIYAPLLDLGQRKELQEERRGFCVGLVIIIIGTVLLLKLMSYIMTSHF